MLRLIIHRTAALYMVRPVSRRVNRSIDLEYPGAHAKGQVEVKPKDPAPAPASSRPAPTLFRHHGYAGTGMKAIVEASDAPYGSRVPLLPRRQGGARRGRARGRRCDLPRARRAGLRRRRRRRRATRAFCAGAAEVLETTDYADACPIATMALEVASASEPMRIAAADAFESWLAVLEQQVHVGRHGSRPSREDRGRAVLRDRGRVPARPGARAQHRGVRRSSAKAPRRGSPPRSTADGLLTG